MSEYGYVERPILNWLCGESKGTYRVGGLGWKYRDEAAMAKFGRPLEDPLVEKLLTEAIVRINPHMENETQAQRAVGALRKAMGQPDRLTANRETLDLLREGARVVLRPGEDARTVQFIEFQTDRQDLNDFTATNQYRVQGVKQCRDDTVLLVNGIPVVVAEYKSYVTSGRGLARGGASAPPLPAPSAVDACPQRLLRGGRRGRIPLRDCAVSRCEQGGRRPPPRPVGPLAQPLSGPSTAGGTSPKPPTPPTRWRRPSRVSCG